MPNQAKRWAQRLLPTLAVLILTGAVFGRSVWEHGYNEWLTRHLERGSLFGQREKVLQQTATITGRYGEVFQFVLLTNSEPTRDYHNFHEVLLLDSNNQIVRQHRLEGTGEFLDCRVDASTEFLDVEITHSLGKNWDYGELIEYRISPESFGLLKRSLKDVRPRWAIQPPGLYHKYYRKKYPNRKRREKVVPVLPERTSRHFPEIVRGAESSVELSKPPGQIE